MQLSISKQMKQTVLGGFGLALLIGLGVSIFIHKLGEVIRSLGSLFGLGGDAETFAVIFDQLQGAKVDLPSWLLLVLCMLLAYGICCYFKLIGRKKADSKLLYAAGIIGGFLWILIALITIVLVTLWFTNVNEVRFGTVIQFLYNALQHGVF